MSSGPQAGDNRRTVNERLLRTSRDALELWLDAAKWWTDAVVEGSGAWRGRNGKVVSEPGGELVYGFPGRQLEAELDGRRIAAKLQSIQLHGGGRDGGRLELSDVEWDGLLSASVSVLAKEVTVTPSPMTVSLTEVEIFGSVPLSELVAWVDRRTPAWRLSVAEPGLITAVTVSEGKRIAFAPSLDGGELVMELREVGWRSLRVRAPRWLRLTRSTALPPLPEGVTIVQATRKDDRVQFVLSLPTFTRPLDLHGPVER